MMERVQEYVEQFAVNCLGVSIVATVAYSVYLFAPYIQPFLLAAYISIPSRQFFSEVQRIHRKNNIEKWIWILKAQQFIPLCSVMMMSCVAGGLLGASIVVLLTILFLKIKMRSPTFFISFLAAAAALMLVAIVLILIREFIGFGRTLIDLSHNIRYGAIVSKSIEYIDDTLRGIFNIDLVDKSSALLGKIGVQETRSTAGLTRMEVVISSLSQVMEHFEKRSLAIVKSQITSENLLTSLKISFAFVNAVITPIIGSLEFVVQTGTFLMALPVFISQRNSLMQYAKGNFTWFKELQGLIDELEDCVVECSRDFLLRVILQLFGSFLVFTIFGSSLAGWWSVLSCILVVFPLVHPSIIAVFAAVEVGFIKESWSLAICLFISHVVFNEFYLPKLKTPYYEGIGYHISELSILVGAWTFGAKGILFGPVLVAIPKIIYNWSRSIGLESQRPATGGDVSATNSARHIYRA